MSELFQTPSFVKKCTLNPLLEPSVTPSGKSPVYNAGVIKYQGKYWMACRIDNGYSKEIFQKAFEEGEQQGRPLHWPKNPITVGLAGSEDGIHWKLENSDWFHPVIPESKNVYDPRLTLIDGRVYLCFACDTPYGVRGGVAVTGDLVNFEVLSLSVPDNRNMVLFPEKINGKLMRLERPFSTYGKSGKEEFDIWCSYSPDGRYWGGSQKVLAGKEVPYANSKIGPGAPPVRTEAGWLCVFHAVQLTPAPLKSWHNKNWCKRYYGGLMLLDLANPEKVISVAQKPLLVPENEYELDGLTGSVIFPGGMILEDSGEVKIYYGAADTCECLATADVRDLIRFALNQ